MRNWLIAIVTVLITHFVLLPYFSSTFAEILVFAGINIILAVSLNLVNGFTGQFSIGHAGFMAVGGYTAAFLTLYAKNNWGLNFEQPVLGQLMLVFGMLAGGLLSAVIGYVVGLPSLRLKGDYLAIVTLGFGEIIRVCILNMPALGDARGLSGIPRLTNFALVYLSVVVCLFVISRLIQSGHGRGLLSVREDEIAAESMGVNTTQAKVRAFAVGAFFAGLAGGLYGHYLTILSPSAFDFNRSFEIVIMVVLGGMGSLSGSVFAAILLTLLREYLRDLREWTVVDLRMIIYSLILIILMLTRPNGIFGTSEIGDWWRAWRARRAAL
ncbi:MAG: branched-chain amino acid ABC transporter permease [Bdellovibrionales bacterium]